MAARVTWNTEFLRKRTSQILGEIGEDLAPEFRAQFQERVYSWKGSNQFTRRKVGKYQGPLVSEPRDIVDTGDLQESQQWAVTSPTTLTFAWGGGFVTYAGAVFFGTPYAGANGPGRDWVTPVTSRYPFLQRFKEGWRKYSGD